MSNILQLIILINKKIIKYDKIYYREVDNMQKKKNKKFIILFLILIMACCVYLYQSALGKYRKQIEGEVSADVAHWNIKLNNEYIGAKKTLTNTITPQYVANNNVKANTIAPGSEAYFDVVIDATDVDTNFNTNIVVESSDTSDVTDLQPTSYIIDPANNNTPSTYSSSISFNTTHNTSSVTVRIFFEWFDGATNNMDNADDTTVGIATAPNVQLKMTANFTQINS